MALSWTPALSRAVRSLPQALLLSEGALQKQSVYTRSESPQEAQQNEGTSREGSSRLTQIRLPYWLEAQERILGNPCLFSTAPKLDHVAVAQSVKNSAPCTLRDFTSRSYGGQAGALQKEDEEVAPVWRRQDVASGFITEGAPSQAMGGSSRCRSVTFGCSTMQGKKETMDDRLAVQFSVRGNKHLGFFGAFDGHGGWSVADYAAHHLHRHIFNSPLVGTSLMQAMIGAYARTDEEVLNYPGQLPGEYGPGLVGSTATTAVVDLGRGQLVVGNVGDSRAVLCKAGRAIRLTAEHTVAEESERERIESNGGQVDADRLCGILNVSRALGDSDLKRWAISDPFVREFQLTSSDEFLVLATDGLWDVLSNEGAVEVVNEAGDAQRAAQMLMEEAMMRRARDDVACLVVFFHWAR